MTVEIRELIIRTEIRSQPNTKDKGLFPEDLTLLKKQLLAECQKLIRKQSGQQGLNR